MSTGIFDLDEDREHVTSTASGAASEGTTSHPTSPISPTSSSAGDIVGPRPASSSLLAPQPAYALPGHRRQTGSFAATPSFPSPLAQAITVPLNSDASSNSSQSSDDERDACSGQESPTTGGSGTPTRKGALLDRPRTASPSHSRGSGSRTGSPTSTEKSVSRPPSPNFSRPPVLLTPSGLLMKTKRSASNPLASGEISSSLPNIVPSPLRDSPPRAGLLAKNLSAPARRVESISRSSSKKESHNRARSGSSSSSAVPSSGLSVAGSSPRNEDSPELFPIDTSPRVYPADANEERDNTLGLGLGWGGWDSQSASGSSLGSNSTALSMAGGGKGKAVERGFPPSPRRDEGVVRNSIGVSSPPRQRRPSEFLNPAGGKPVMGFSRQSISGTPVATLSTSTSMISPLNPMPSPWSSSSSESSAFGSPNPPDTSSSATSGSGAIRLNRVPTAVKLATELMKTSSPAPLSPVTRASELPKVGSTAPVLAKQPSREASLTALMPPPPAPHPPGVLDVGKGRPTLSVPGTPVNTSFTAGQTLGTPVTITSSHPVPPPSLFRAPGHSQSNPRLRPSPPKLLASPEPFLTVGPARNRYRTSMHESISQPVVLDEISDSPPQWSPRQVPPATPEAPQGSQYGLGLNLPSSSLLQPPNSLGGRSASTSGPKPRMRTTTEKTYQMDLAGVTNMGDAASHANMIMQSRQAKLQKWRPNSAGNATGSERPVPPAFGRSTTSGTPAMLAIPRNERQAEWNLREHPRASSFGEDLPHFPSVMDVAARAAGDPSIPSEAGSRSPHVPSPFSGGMGMERQSSASGTVGGIDWVDWYECYKRYKAQKIRAEAEVVRAKEVIPEDSPVDHASKGIDGSPAATIAGKAISAVTAAVNDADSAIALTPTTSRDDHEGFAEYRRRSPSIRSSFSGHDFKSRKASIFERPRQTSGGSARSTDTGSTAATKRKKNLVAKMEGWWNAVKSNFTPESQHPPPYHPSTLGPGHGRRIPSAPSSRRGSEMSPASDAVPTLLSPAPVAAPSKSKPPLRTVTSHADFRSRSATPEPPMTVSTSADLAGLSVKPPPVTAGQDKMLSSLAPTRSGEEPASRSSLDSRRRQPNLRLDLESNVLSKPTGRIPGTLVHRDSNEKTSSQPSQRPSETTSRSSSYGPLYGPGLTPGIPLWQQTPSPIVPLEASPASDIANRPVAPGAELTVASVRHHVKRRLNAAKEICDYKLRETIASITRYAEDQRGTLDRPFEDDEDYFEAIDDSPVIDADDSEIELGDAFDGLGPRLSQSRGPSRRASISRPTPGHSPARRMSMLPSSPSRPRRRTNTAPRAVTSRDRMMRGVNLADRTNSASSSRSTSRSRSPMPQIAPSDADRKFLAALQELIILATDVLEATINQLLAKPTLCADIIQKVQKAGQLWDEHTDWPGREWYVDILLAVAKLSQVLDWWEAEKGFWNFDAEEVEHEPLLFVMKPSNQESRFDEQFGAALGDINSQDPSPQPGSSPAFGPGHLPDSTPGLGLDSISPTSTVPPDLKQARVTVTTQVARSETPQMQAVEDLKFLADHAKSVNIVMELSLHGEEIQYINDAVSEVTGRDPDDVLFKPITEILAPADASTFAEATQKLLEDDSNTVQLRVRLELQDAQAVADEVRAPGPMYVEVEGVGMLMREFGEPSHSMWVLKPVPATQTEGTEATFPLDGRIAVEGILCRICERDIATWFFEKHNETCDAVHRLEAEITECDECLGDLRKTVLTLNAQIDETAGEPANYQGVLMVELPESVVAKDGQVDLEPQLIERRKVIHEHLLEVSDILHVAQQIMAPAVQEEETDLPFNLQRYLDPESEDKLAQITRWQKPPTADHALALLFTHVADQLRRKHKAIARLQSTIRYSEKTRHEWEDKVNHLMEEQDGSGSGSDSGSNSPDEPDISITTVTDSGEAGNSPPGHRKIAPQARLPVTLGHSGRPSTAHGDTALPTVPPTPMRRISAPASPAVDPLVAAPVQIKVAKAVVPDTSHIGAPLLVPGEVGHRGHARRPSKAFRDMPLSPRIPSTVLNRAAPPSIKDFEIIKPISRGAFGSVYLAKKVATGDYFAIKALKKSDMIAKNQITNVKAERTILMNQASSPHVVKLFFSFQSKEYLYLVMEYLNGGDCSSLVKTLGGLPEDWSRTYIAEVVLGLEYLHDRNIVHRDIKPDNLLIDSKGHLKLTDFGLSRIGLLNRQVAGPRPAYLRGTSLRASVRGRPGMARTPSISSADSPMLSPEMTAQAHRQGYFGGLLDPESADESSGSESANVIPKQIRQMSSLTKHSSDLNTPSVSGREPPKVVGTPDYLAPESILGIGTDDRAVDWWALGVVLYEFLYGIPPFHAETPEKVFDNIVSRRIDWHEDEVEVSHEARDLMNRLMCSNPADRMGARGAVEVKQHVFFADIDWDCITEGEASFVPQVTDPESTDYFDARGAVHGFHDEDPAPQLSKPVLEPSDSPQKLAAMHDVVQDIAGQEDFGTFNFKNLPVLKQANDDMIRKLRVDSLAPIGASLDSLMAVDRARSSSSQMRSKRKASDLAGSQGPPSPTTSISSSASTPSRSSAAPTTPSTVPPINIRPQHLRRPSELNALDRVKSTDDGDLARRSSAPTRIRAGSGSSVVSDRSTSMELWRQRRQVSLHSDQAQASSLPASNAPLDSPQIPSGTMDRALDVLIAEDNPISQKILETLLTRMGCRCICVEDGPQALAATMGSIRFDVIICDIHMPVVNGEQVARMIRSTNNHNQHTPIIAATSYEQYQAISEEGTLFSAVLAKPVSKLDLTRCLGKLGFILSSNAGDTSSQTP